MRLNQATHWFYVAGLVLFLAGLILFPIHFPVTTVEENPDPGSVFSLYQGHALQQTIEPTDTNLSAIGFWTNGVPALPKNEPLILTIRAYPGNQLIRQIQTSWQQVFSANSHELRFSFPIIWHDDGTQYAVTLEAPSLTQGMSLPIRRPLLTNDAAAVELLATKPFITILSRQVFNQDLSQEDIYYYWHRGRQILNGDNPYACALDDTCLDHKNPGHFPLFYWLAAGTEKLGFDDFQSWIDVWRPIFVIAEILIGTIIFQVLYQRKQPILALFGLLFWLLNRWSLYVLSVGQIDFLSILFLVLSIVTFDKKRWVSLLLFSFSLALKQLAIFLLPLYMVILWREARNNRLQTTAMGTGVMLSVPLVASLPFLLHQPKALFTGLFFSVTRTSESDLGAPAFSRLAHLQGASSIALMGVIMGIIYLVALRRKTLTLSIGALAVYFTFLAFNAILFNQYFAWLMALLPLAISELLWQQEAPI